MVDCRVPRKAASLIAIVRLTRCLQEVHFVVSSCSTKKIIDNLELSEISLMKISLHYYHSTHLTRSAHSRPQQTIECIPHLHYTHTCFQLSSHFARYAKQSITHTNNSQSNACCIVLTQIAVTYAPQVHHPPYGHVPRGHLFSRPSRSPSRRCRM